MAIKLFGVTIETNKTEEEEEEKKKTIELEEKEEKKKMIELEEKEEEEEETRKPKRRKSLIKKSNTFSSLPPAPLPFPIIQTIRDMEGKDQVFITRKILEWSDTAKNENRFFVPKSDVLYEVLSKEEMIVVEGREGLEVVVVDPRGGTYSMKLRKWMSLKKIVLNSGWQKFVDDNNLQPVVDCVELWSFRTDTKLCFAFNVQRAE